MFEEVISLKNLFCAWTAFSAGKMAKVDVLHFARRLEDNIFNLHNELASGRYHHGSYRQFYIHDPKRRFISCATVRDRVVHQAFVQKLEPVFEPTFIYDSFASRRGKGTHAAISRLEHFFRQASFNYRRPAYVLKCDIRRFFDSIMHATLLTIIRQKITDGRLLALLHEIVISYSTNALRTRGLPLGNVTSQLLANVYLNGFDHFAKERLRAQWYVRFCDDFVIVHYNRRFLETLVKPVTKYLYRHLLLTLHPKKVTLRKLFSGCDFVGQVLRPHYRIVRTATTRRMFRAARLRIRHYRGGMIDVNDLRSSLQSWFGVLSHGSNVGTIVGLQEIARRSLFAE